jgi:hypothetical protein
MLMELSKNALRILCIAALLVVLFTPQSFADLYSGSRNAGTGGGLTATGAWNASTTSLTWLVQNMGTFYRYTYTFTALDKALSHFILQVSDNFDENSLVPGSLTPTELIALLGTYEGTGDDKPNPGMPGSVYGLKFENEKDNDDSDDYFGVGTTWTWSFDSYRGPMWGHAYAVDGYDKASELYPHLYNSSFGTPYAVGASTLGYVSVPDTQVIPLPPAVLLGAIGLSCAGWRLKRKNQA